MKLFNRNLRFMASFDPSYFGFLGFSFGVTKYETFLEIGFWKKLLVLQFYYDKT